MAIAQGDQDSALESFQAAEALALEMNLRPIVWQSRLAQANIYDQAGQTAEADSRRQDALAVVEEIGLLFEDDTLRSQFRESAIEQINHRPAG